METDWNNRTQTVHVEQGDNLLLISDDILDRMLNKMKAANAKEFVVSIGELMPWKYLIYWRTFINSNRGKRRELIFPEIPLSICTIEDVLRIMAQQISTMEINGKRCFQNVKVYQADRMDAYFKCLLREKIDF
jgi:hypothetical protein